MLRILSLVLALAAHTASACEVRDFLTEPLRNGVDPVGTALAQAYDVDVQGNQIILPKGAVPLGEVRDVSPIERLDGATVRDQFVYVYPLGFSLKQRITPFHDPGRVRSDALFRALWFSAKAGASASLVTVRFQGAKLTQGFRVTTKYCVHVQLKAALAEIAGHGPSMDRFFQKVGGSFNWRRVSGTARLSSHSFGAAVDINTQLGQYWKWAGVAAGKAARYDNKIPEALVRAFERRGFIWGGKWHHFDGMHFEYRPELLLYARMVQ